MTADEIINLLKKEVVPAYGCTEPVAIALTSAQAKKLVAGPVKELKMIVSGNVYKNAKAVGIPGTVHTGVKLAAVLGVTLQEPALDLTIFANLNEADVDKALAVLDEVPVLLEIAYDVPSVYIEVQIQTDSGAVAAVTAGCHTNLVRLVKNGAVVYSKPEECGAEKTEKTLMEYSLQDLLKTTIAIPCSSLDFLHEGIELNMAIAETGTRMEAGMRIGTKWHSLMSRGLLQNDLTNSISYYTAAACDARMAGIQMPVMSSAGSGNHGLVAVIPIAVAAKELKSSRDKTVQALAVSHLVTVYVKEFTGRLSSVCGCGVAAGAGVSAGLAWLLGGGIEDISRAVANTISCLAGMICDGGKVGCALKLSTSAYTAWTSALLAIEGLEVPSGNGIVGDSVERTIANLGKVSSEGMAHVDKAIISVMDKHGA